MDRVRVGLVGGGRIADLNVIGWLEHPRGEVAAICDIDPEIRSRRAREWNCREVATFDELLADDAIDAIEILTPHHLHAEQAIAALEAGRHVSLQKPPTRTMAEFEAVASAAAAAPGTFRVFENFMFYPPNVLARELVDDGAIGDVLSVRLITAAGRMGAGEGWDLGAATEEWRMRPELCGGGRQTFDHGYHCYKMGRFFVDDPIDSVHAYINFFHAGEYFLDVPSLITWRYAGVPPRYGSWETILSLDMDIRSEYYVSDDRIELRGAQGIIWVNRCTGQMLEEPSVVLYRDGEVRSFHRLETDWSVSFRNATFDFIDAIVEGRQPEETADEARETLRFALAAQLSGQENREVSPSEIE